MVLKGNYGKNLHRRKLLELPKLLQKADDSSYDRSFYEQSRPVGGGRGWNRRSFILFLLRIPRNDCPFRFSGCPHWLSTPFHPMVYLVSAAPQNRCNVSICQYVLLRALEQGLRSNDSNKESRGQRPRHQLINLKKFQQ